jgi:cobalt-zinc-cadmium resistance protein CzcA
MSLGAIDFGLVVDGAVIIVENCLRRLSGRQHALGRTLVLHERVQEVFKASREVLTPLAYGQTIIVIVYVPVLFLTGVEGKMFYPMALTVIFALLAAFVLSFTFIPAMVATGVRGKVEEKETRVVERAKSLYEPVLRWALRNRITVVAGAVLAFAGSLVLFARLGQEFVPTLSELDFSVQAIRIPSTSLSQSSDLQFAVERAAKQVPEVAFAFSKTGTAEVAADPMPVNASDTFIILKPRSEWPDPGETKDDVRKKIEAAVTAIPGTNYEFTQPIQMRFNELIAGVRGDVAVKIFGDDFDAMLPAAQRVARALQSIPGATDLRVEQISGLPALNVEIDRAAIARYGLSVADVQDVVSVAIGGREAGQLFQGDRRFDIIVRLPEHFRRDLAHLENLPVPVPPSETVSFHPFEAASQSSPSGASFIPLGLVAKLTLSEGPNQISRENGKRRVVVQLNVRDRDIGSFVAEAKAKIAESVKLPSGSWLEWGGQFENLMSARQRLSIVVPLCFVVIFLLLYSAFDSVRYSALVFSGIPLALSGGIATLWLRGMSFSISAAVGFIALSGVAVLDGLVMVIFINQLREAGHSRDEAALSGALARFRAIVMTALVASLGFVPMALATGTGAEVQRPLATVVIGGLISSTALKLIVLPALYSLFATADQSDEEAPA